MEHNFPAVVSLCRHQHAPATPPGLALHAQVSVPLAIMAVSHAILIATTAVVTARVTTAPMELAVYATMVGQGKGVVFLHPLALMLKPLLAA